MATAQETIASAVPTLVTIGVAGKALGMLDTIGKPRRKRKKKRRKKINYPFIKKKYKR